MYIEKGDFFAIKHDMEDAFLKKIERYGTDYEIIAHESFDLVDCSDDEEDRIISNILFQKYVLTYTGKLYYLPSLIKDIETIEHGFKFKRLQLNDNELRCLYEKVSYLKEYITSNNQLLTWYDSYSEK